MTILSSAVLMEDNTNPEPKAQTQILNGTEEYSSPTTPSSIPTPSSYPAQSNSSLPSITDPAPTATPQIYPTTTSPSPTDLASAKPDDSQTLGSHIMVQTTSSNASIQDNPYLKIGIYKTNPEVYAPEPADTINWGSLSLGQTKNSSTVYFKNEGKTPIKMSLTSEHWILMDAQGHYLTEDYQKYFNLSWTYNNTEIAVNEIKPITFTLNISPNIADVTSFSFNIVVILTE
jgi:hypothetical protein